MDNLFIYIIIEYSVRQYTTYTNYKKKTFKKPLKYDTHYKKTIQKKKRT